MKKIIFIDETLIADKDGYQWLGSLWDELSNLSEDEVYLNFDYVKSIDANLSAAIGAMLDVVSDNGKKIFLSTPRNKSVRKSLSRIGFLRAFDVSTTVQEKESFITFKRFSVKESSQFKEYIHTDLIQKERFPQCTKRAEEKIIESIYEVFANAVSHSGCKMIYSCGESHDHDSVPMLDMTITNLGKTIPENVNAFLETRKRDSLSPEEALLWAFKEGNTTKNIPGGLGLAILKDFINLNEGEIQMVSGNAILAYKNKEFTTTPLDKDFPGTIVNLKFNCADRKSYKLTNEITNPQDLF